MHAVGDGICLSDSGEEDDCAWRETTIGLRVVVTAVLSDGHSHTLREVEFLHLKHFGRCKSHLFFFFLPG